MRRDQLNNFIDVPNLLSRCGPVLKSLDSWRAISARVTFSLFVFDNSSLLFFFCLCYYLLLFFLNTKHTFCYNASDYQYQHALFCSILNETFKNVNICFFVFFFSSFCFYSKIQWKFCLLCNCVCVTVNWVNVRISFTSSFNALLFSVICTNIYNVQYPKFLRRSRSPLASHIIIFLLREKLLQLFPRVFQDWLCQDNHCQNFNFFFRLRFWKKKSIVQKKMWVRC